jgi:hypothetical protein
MQKKADAILQTHDSRQSEVFHSFCLTEEKTISFQYSEIDNSNTAL